MFSLKVFQSPENFTQPLVAMDVSSSTLIYFITYAVLLQIWYCQSYVNFGVRTACLKI